MRREEGDNLQSYECVSWSVSSDAHYGSQFCIADWIWCLVACRSEVVTDEGAFHKFISIAALHTATQHLACPLTLSLRQATSGVFSDCAAYACSPFCLCFFDLYPFNRCAGGVAIEYLAAVDLRGE